MYCITTRRNTMRIGTDSSIAECRRSGYLVMEFPKRELIKKGVLNKECYATFSVSNPMGWNDAGRPDIGSGYPLWVFNDVHLTFEDLLSLIKEPKDRESVASCCDWEHCQPNLDNPNEYDMLHLASDINAAIGIE
jgi:hypothetical protein